MSSSDPDAVFAVLRAADPDVMDRDELVEFVHDVASLRSWCDSLNVRATRRQRQLAADGRAEAPKDLLAREGGQSGREARAGEDREKVCSALPNFEDALARGSVAAGHVDAIAGSIRNLDETVTAEFLAQGHEFAVLCVGGDATYGRELADTIVEAIRVPLITNGCRMQIGASIGVAVGAQPLIPALLSKQADDALYRAKHTGKNTVCVAS
jgi:Diguanylate cyclase, GGDEF domain